MNKTINGILELVSQQIPKEYHIGQKLTFKFIIKLPLVFEEPIIITSVGGFYNIKILSSNIGYIDSLKNKIYNINVTLTPGDILTIEIHGEIDSTFESDIIVEPLIKYKTSSGIGFTRFGPFRIRKADKHTEKRHPLSHNLSHERTPIKNKHSLTNEKALENFSTYLEDRYEVKKNIYMVISVGSSEFIKVFEEETKKLTTKVKFIPIVLDQNRNITRKEPLLDLERFVNSNECNAGITFVIMVIEKTPKNANNVIRELDNLLSCNNVYLFTIIPNNEFQDARLLFENLKHKNDISLIKVIGRQTKEKHKGIFNILKFLVEFYAEYLASPNIDFTELIKYARFSYESHLCYYGEFIIKEKEKINKMINLLRSRISKIKKVLAIFIVNRETSLKDVRDWLKNTDEIDEKQEISVEWASIVDPSIETGRLELMVLEKAEG